jgi:hypothetical protein
MVLGMDTQAQLLAEIEDFLSTRKMAETTFGRMAVNDGKFVSRLRSGANMTLATIERARVHIKTQRAASTSSHADAEAAI